MFIFLFVVMFNCHINLSYMLSFMGLGANEIVKKSFHRIYNKNILTELNQIKPIKYL